MNGGKILEGLTEALEFSRGKDTGAKTTRIRVPANVDVTAIRKRLQLSQSEFAARFGFTLSTVQNWEQGHRTPEGPARTLLKIIDSDPQVVDRALVE